MLIHNINIPDGLVNGALGTVIDILLADQSRDVGVIIVAFDNPYVGSEQRREFSHLANLYLDQGGTPIYRSTLEYQIRTRGRIHGASCKVTQFPLRLAWAVTGHKV